MRTQVIILCVLCAILIGMPYVVRDPLEIRPYEQLRPPSSDFLFGTDLLGRDVLARLAYGGRATFILALSAASVAAGWAIILRVIGLAVTGWLGEGWLHVLSRALMAIPPVVLALVLSSLTRRAGEGDIGRVIAVGLVLGAPFLRVMLSAERIALVQGYVEASRALGASRWHIWQVHVLRTIMPQLATFFGVTCAHAILLSASLGFLGFGGDWSEPEWGRMLFEGRQVLRAAPWVALAPGLGITLLTAITLSMANSFTRYGR